MDQQFGRLAPEVMKKYPIDRYPSPSAFIAYRTIMADAFSVCPAVMSFQSAGDSMQVPASTLAAQHNCGFWDPVNKSAPWAP